MNLEWNLEILMESQESWNPEWNLRISSESPWNLKIPESLTEFWPVADPSMSSVHEHAICPVSRV